MSDNKVRTMGEVDLGQYFPADPDGVWISSNELTPLEISSCQCVPDECWIAHDDGLGWAKIRKEVAIERLAIAAYETYSSTRKIEAAPKFSELEEKTQEAWRNAIAHVLWQVRYD